MTIDQAVQICVAALLGAFTVVLLMAAFLILCVVMRAIARVLSPGDFPDLPR